MKRCALSFFVFFFTNILFGQYHGTSLWHTSADAIIDAKNISLGESAAANPSLLTSFISNPANLSEQKETSVFFNRRSNNYADQECDNYLLSSGIILPTSLGNFSFSYNSQILTYTAYHSIFDYESINYTLALTYANNICDNLSFGVSIKAFRFITDYTRYDFVYYNNITTKMHFFADVGFLYKFEKIFGSNDKLYFGASAQNLGSEIFLKTETNYEDQNGNINYPLAQYLRAGMSYDLIIPTGLNENTLEFILSGEYRNHLNPTDLEKSAVDGFGTGLETKLFNLLSFNIGGIYRNEETAYYEKQKLYLYYGFSGIFPLKLFSDSLPYKIAFSYGIMPVPDAFSMFGVKNMNSFSISVGYEGLFF